ncbi:hypothetical protein LCGC14_2092750 [marine sediment metagenome]|uniref:Uncharacterized protein n=1 Tax=marine sediment metagenome TaxID=412755 RepID=A0A0F9ECF8_9ZZZZ
MKKKQWKSKKQRQQWWKEQTSDQQAVHLARWQKVKSATRRTSSVELMDKINVLFSCKKCFHGIVKACTDNLPKGCEYWYKPGSDVIGLAYG